MRLLFMFLFLTNTCFAQLGNPERPVYQQLLSPQTEMKDEDSQTNELVDAMPFDEFEANWLSQKHGKVTVYNFWATWCKPCVKELPYFEKVQAEYEDKGVNVVLVSLDNVEKLDDEVKPFVKKRGLQSEVLLLNAPDYNAWIDKVSADWSGSIPATLVINHNTGEEEFYEKEFTYEELNTVMQNQLNP